MKQIEGKVVLVTGGSRGIGYGVALALAVQGAKIVIAARSATEIEQAQAALRSRGAEVVGAVADVTEAAQVDELVGKALSAFGRVDVLINAAGVQGPVGPLWMADPKQWRAAVDVNLFGTMLCCRAAVPHMLTLGGGKIVNFSGGGATGPRANFSAYAAAKAAVVRMTETLAEELRPFNIDVNAIAPGMIDTKMLDAIVQAGAAAGSEIGSVEARRADPQGFVPVEVPAGLAVFLASAASDGLTGKLISAPHDDWQSWDREKIERLSALPWLTLRRIDQHTLRPLIAEL